MPKIEQYTRRNLPTSTSRVRATGAAFGAGAGDSLAAAGRQLEDYANKRAEREYIAKMSEFELENVKALEELKTQDFGDEDLVTAYENNLEMRASQLEISPLVRDRFQTDMAQMKMNFAKSGLEEGVRREGVKAKLEFENTVQSWNEIVGKNPNRKQEAINAVNAVIANNPTLAPEDRAYMMDAVSDDFDKIQKSAFATARANAIEADPMGVLRNPEGYNKEELETARKLVLGMEEKAQENIEIAAIMGNAKDAEDLFYGRMTVARYHELKGEQGDSAFVKMAAKRLFKDAEKIKRTDAEKGTKFAELLAKQQILFSKMGPEGDEDISLEFLKEYQDFQREVDEASFGNYLSESETQNFKSKFVGPILTAINNKNVAPTEKTTQRGIQSPYKYIFGKNRLENHLGKMGLDNNLYYKKNIIEKFASELEEYESSGNFAKDEETMSKALLEATKKTNRDMGYVFETEPNMVVPKTRIERRKDAQGNVADVEVDLEGNFIRVIKVIEEAK